MDDDDISQIREALLQTVGADPAAARDAVAEFGWDELLADQEDIAVATLLPIWGRSLAHGSVLAPVMLRAGGVAFPTATRIVLPRLNSSAVPGRYDGESVVVDGVLAAGAGPILVPAVSDGDIVFAVCEAPELAAGDPLDPTAGWTRLAGTFTVTEQLSPSGHTASQSWPLMVAAGRRALTYELLGAAQAMLAMTVDHVTSRQQFGQALGSFQAVKHQLADVHLWIEVAQLAADAAWEDRGEESAALAKSAGVRASATARKVCQQLLGGMGFTWEHDFHRYLRRALTLEPLLGGSSDLHRELGAALRAGAVSPALAPL